MLKAGKIICILGFSLAFAVQAQPSLESPIEFIGHRTSEIYQGYLFWHQVDEIGEEYENISLLTDANGLVVNQWQTNLTGGGTAAYLLPSGGVLRMGRPEGTTIRNQPVASADTVQITDAAGKVIWEVRSSQVGGLLFHHDLEPMPNGNVLITTYEPISADQARQLGWDPGDQEVIWSDGVIEVEPDLELGTSKVVWQWRVADHIVQDRLPQAANFAVIADHPERIDPHYPTNYAPLNHVRQHINSVDYNPELNQILLSSFIYDEIWIVDHSTTLEEAAGSHGGNSGLGGDLLFRYGNPEAYDRGSSDDRIFQRQHDANWIDSGLPGEGNILVHNNNIVMRPPAQAARVMDLGELTNRGRDLIQADGVSNVYELRLPRQEGGRYTIAEGATYEADTVWFWENPDYFAEFQGGARRLPNGNTLITDTAENLVVEVNAASDIVAEYRGYTPSYKVFKYSEDFVENILE